MDLPDLGQGLDDLAALAALIDDLEDLAKRWQVSASEIKDPAHASRSEAVMVVALCAAGAAATIRAIAKDLDLDAPDNSEAAAFVDLSMRSMMRAQSHLYALADEEPEG